MDAVIVTHNSAADLRTQVASRATLESFDRVLVADNASTDDTRKVAADAGLEVISLDANRGLAAAANVGVDRASGPSFALLNPDVRATSAGEFERLEEALEDDKVGAVAPALVLPDGTLQDSARWVPTPVDLVVRRVSRADRGAVRVTYPVDVEWATAACLVVRRWRLRSDRRLRRELLPLLRGRGPLRPPPGRRLPGSLRPDRSRAS